MYKIVESAAQLANCILLQAYSNTTALPSCSSTSKIFSKLIYKTGIIVFLVIN